MKVIRNTWQTWQCGKFLPLTHSVAKANAIRCDGKVNAFRWPMQYIDFTDALRQESHKTASIFMSYASHGMLSKS